MSGSPRPKYLARIALGAAIAVALAGCGGGDGDDETTAAAGPSTRLSAADWASYVAARDKAQAANESATKTFMNCRELIDAGAQSADVEKCFGTAITEVVTESGAFIDALAQVSGETSGACAEANYQLAGDVKLYAATARAMSQTVLRDEVPTPQEVDESLEMIATTKESSAAFDSACEPE